MTPSHIPGAADFLTSRQQKKITGVPQGTRLGPITFLANDQRNVSFNCINCLQIVRLLLNAGEAGYSLVHHPGILSPLRIPYGKLNRNLF